MPRVVSSSCKVTQDAVMFGWSRAPTSGLHVPFSSIKAIPALYKYCIMLVKQAIKPETGFKSRSLHRRCVIELGYNTPFNLVMDLSPLRQRFCSS
ncbi:unnamed protein product [Fusarium venenatum]|uniref:Uncharacterized protein n=1 Tax=Fusarium venenatum TaxID=56646 RepID=A0A2L2T8Z1_9HYPO|nr:uncharacterized protein FVRRES_02960 [Fusarium venenatum]CEI66448.1 unnamed protein product [Fusarium venenatum]